MHGGCADPLIGEQEFRLAVKRIRTHACYRHVLQMLDQIGSLLFDFIASHGSLVRTPPLDNMSQVIALRSPKATLLAITNELSACEG